MRIRADVSKFKFLFSLGLQQKNLPSEYFVMRCLPKGVMISEVWRDVLGVYGLFHPSYFEEYSCDKQEDVPITLNFWKIFSHLRGLNTVLRTDNGKLVVESGNERYYEGLTNCQFQSFPLELEFVGEYIKPKRQEEVVSGKLTIDEFNSLPKMPYIQFISSQNSLNIRLTQSNQPSREVQGVFEMTPNFQPKVMNDLTLTLNNEYFSEMISPLTGPVWIVLDKTGISLSQVTKDYAICLVLAGLV